MPKNNKFLKGFAVAFSGLWFCIKNERNMRIHTVVGLYTLFFAPFLDVTRTQYALLVLLTGIVITAEALNTSVEKLCDFATTERNPMIKIVKDVAAGAVLVSAMTAVCIGLVLLFKPDEIKVLLSNIFANIWYAVALITSLILSLIYIIGIPFRRKHE